MNEDKKYELYDRAGKWLKTIDGLLDEITILDDRKEQEGKMNDVNGLVKKFNNTMQLLNDDAFQGLDLLSPEGVQKAMDIMNEPDTKGWRPSADSSHTDTFGARETRFLNSTEPKTFRNMFRAKNQGARLDNGGFNTFNEFTQAVFSGMADNRLHNLNVKAMSEGIPSDGGFAVPEEYAATLVDKALEKQIVKPRTTVIPMKYLTKKVSAWDGYNHTSALFGGISIGYTAEAGTISQNTPKLREMELQAKKLAALITLSSELMNDSPDFGNNLAAALIDSFAWFEDYYYLMGNGAGQPLGILNDPALITVSKETSQASGTIVYENLTKMFARMHGACLPEAVWICNQTAIPQILELTIPVGTGGTFYPILKEDGQGGFTMLTKPVIFTEKLPELGTKGDIIFADLSQYFIGERSQVQIKTTDLLHFNTDQIDVRGILRHDAQGSWSEPVTPKNGDSLSWCVTLEARS
jgi:HK97 family phage major capsid protein